jgi:hypothetical protein
LVKGDRNNDGCQLPAASFQLGERSWERGSWELVAGSRYV